MVNKVKNLPLDDLLDAISSLIRSLGKEKMKNMHLKELVGILKERLENTTRSDKLYDLEVENKGLREQVDTLKIALESQRVNFSKMG